MHSWCNFLSMIITLRTFHAGEIRRQLKQYAWVPSIQSLKCGEDSGHQHAEFQPLMFLYISSIPYFYNLSFRKKGAAYIWILLFSFVHEFCTGSLKKPMWTEANWFGIMTTNGIWQKLTNNQSSITFWPQKNLEYGRGSKRPAAYTHVVPTSNLVLKLQFSYPNIRLQLFKRWIALSTG